MASSLALHAHRTAVRQNPPVLALEALFWVCAALIVWTQLGYALALADVAPLFRRPRPEPPAIHQRSPERGGAHQNQEPPPLVSLIVAAHNEQQVIAQKVANALALDYPRERLQVIVACNVCTDATAARAGDAGADLVLEL